MEQAAGEAQSGGGGAQQQTSPPRQSPPPHHHHQPPFSLPPSTVPSSNSPSPNPSTTTSLPSFHRPWDPQTHHFRHFSSASAPPPSTSSPATGMAIGVPAHHPTPQMAPPSFSSLNPNFGQRFGSLALGTPESAPSSSSLQGRPTIQGTQGMAMRGTMSTGSQLRAGGITMQHQQRPIQSSVRPQNTPTNKPSTLQNPQTYGMPRGPTVGSPAASLSPGGTSQGPQNQPWLSSTTRPPLPNAPFRAQLNHHPSPPQSLQQRSHMPPQQQQHHHPPIPPIMPPQRPPHQQQQPSSSSSSLEGTQETQQQILKGTEIGNRKLVANSASQPVLTGTLDKTASVEIVETCTRIISKRSIQELVSQIDPTEKLDPEVEDILVDIAEDFVESLTSSACSLAKHRKSTTLEAKDILLHLDRNWNITLPGFTGDEIKCYKKPSVNDIHKERLAVIKKSVATGDIVKSSTGQAAGSAKGHSAKAEVAQS